MTEDLGDETRTDATGTAIDFRVNGRSELGWLVGFVAVLVASGNWLVPNAAGWTGVFLSIAAIIGIIGLAELFERATTRTIELSTRALRIRTRHFGYPASDVLLPLETVRKVEVWGPRAWSALRVIETDGTVHRVRLGSLADHQQVARWLNENLKQVEWLEDKPENLIPIDLTKLSRAASRATDRART